MLIKRNESGAIQSLDNKEVKCWKKHASMRAEVITPCCYNKGKKQQVFQLIQVKI